MGPLKGWRIVIRRQSRYEQAGARKNADSFSLINLLKGKTVYLSVHSPYTRVDYEPRFDRVQKYSKSS